MEKKIIKIKDEIISLEHIFNIVKLDKERSIRLAYLVDGKIINYELDYSEIKDDVNEEKTKLEQDYEMLVNYLVKEWIELEKYEKLEDEHKELLHDYMILVDQKNLNLDRIIKIKEECRKKKLAFKKIKRIKKIFYE